MDERQRRQVCELVAGVIAADRRIVPAESDFLVRLLDALGLSDEDDIAVSLVTDERQAERIARELPDDIRREAFEFMLEAAVVDGQVAPEERHYLLRTARLLAIDETELDARLADVLAAASGVG